MRKLHETTINIKFFHKIELYAICIINIFKTEEQMTPMCNCKKTILSFLSSSSVSI